MNRWDVYLGRRLIDTVYYLPSCTDEYVRRTLVNHDGYHPNIRVVLSKRALQ